MVRTDSTAIGFTTVLIASAAAVSAALWFPIAHGVTVCLAACVALAPVWWRAAGEYLFGRAVIVVGVLAGVWGVILTLVGQSRDVSISIMQGHTLNLLAFVGSIGMLLWCRSQLGIGRTAMWFGVGSLANVLVMGIDGENPWKFSFAVPVALVILGVASVTNRRGIEIVVFIGLGTMSLVSDSRSMTAFFALAIPVVVWQLIGAEKRRESRPWQAIIWLSALAFGAYNLFQSLLLDGVLGQAAQQRTALQVERSGSLILGGRPEAGAAAALVAARPVGYGSGTQPSSTDIWTAKSGMSALGYDPDNGYVDEYMFGYKYEVHSVLGDFWIRFGPLGAALTLLLVGVAIYAVARAVSARECPGVVVYLLLLGTWNVFFSPALPSMRTLALLFALAAIPIALSRRARRVTAPPEPIVRTSWPRSVVQRPRERQAAPFPTPMPRPRSGSAPATPGPRWR